MANIDYKELLIKYMKFVQYCSQHSEFFSGVDLNQFARESLENVGELTFTDVEWDELNKLLKS